MILGLKIYKYKIFSTLKPTTSPMYFSISSDIMFKAFNFQCFDAFYCLKREKNNVQLNTLGVSNMPFQHPYYFLLSFCHSLSTLLSFCSSPIFVIHGVVYVCFFGPKIGYQLNKNLNILTLVEINQNFVICTH